MDSDNKIDWGLQGKLQCDWFPMEAESLERQGSKRGTRKSPYWSIKVDTGPQGKELFHRQLMLAWFFCFVFSTLKIYWLFCFEIFTLLMGSKSTAGMEGEGIIVMTIWSHCLPQPISSWRGRKERNLPPSRVCTEKLWWRKNNRDIRTGPGSFSFFCFIQNC